MPQTHTTPTVGAELGELMPLVCSVAIYGPPIIFLAVPWLVLGLILSGPFAVVLTIVIALVAATALVAGLVALLAAPFLLTRRAAA